MPASSFFFNLKMNLIRIRLVFRSGLTDDIALSIWMSDMLVSLEEASEDTAIVGVVVAAAP